MMAFKCSFLNNLHSRVPSASTATCCLGDRIAPNIVLRQTEADGQCLIGYTLIENCANTVFVP